MVYFMVRTVRISLTLPLGPMKRTNWPISTCRPILLLPVHID
jgi:hypothetical protein